MCLANSLARSINPYLGDMEAISLPELEHFVTDGCFQRTGEIYRVALVYSNVPLVVQNTRIIFYICCDFKDLGELTELKIIYSNFQRSLNQHRCTNEGVLGIAYVFPKLGP